MKRSLVLIFSILAVSGCTSAKGSRAISDYTEAREYSDCVKGKALTYALQFGSPNELAQIAVGACRVEKNLFETALRRDNSAVFVNELMRLNYKTMVEIAAELILETRMK